MSMVILARGHGSGSVDKQCSNSEVRSAEMTGRASPCGRWSLNSAPTWEFPPLAIANQYHDQQADEVKRARYRLILVRGSDLRWLNRERLQEVKTGLATQHKWLPEQTLPFSEVVLYAADGTPFPTYVCLPSGLYKARTGQVVAQTGIYFFDGWRLHPTVEVPLWPPCLYHFFRPCLGPMRKHV